MTSKAKKVSDLSYVGSRDYIRGVDLIKFFFVNNTFAKNNRIIRFSVNKPILKNGEWVLDNNKKPSNYSAFLSLDDQKGNQSFWFIENASKVVRRDNDVPSLVSKINTNKSLCGSFEFKEKIIGENFLDGIVEANKKLHALEDQKIVNGSPKIQLVYFENINGLNFKHSKININNLFLRTTNDTIFTLSEVFSPFLKDPIKICFSYLKNK